MNVIVEIFFIFLQAVTTAFQIQVKDYDTYKHHLQEFELCHVFKMYFPNVEFIHYSRKQCLLTYQDDFVYLYLMFFGAQKSGKNFFVTNQNFAWNLLKIIQNKICKQKTIYSCWNNKLLSAELWLVFLYNMNPYSANSEKKLQRAFQY